jgi:ATP-dependent Zn protease
MAQPISYRKCLLSLLTIASLSTSSIKAHNRSLTTSQSSISELQERQVRALKQIDLSESILDTLGQSVASGASKLSPKRKTVVQLQLKTLRKEMGTIKDAAAVHVDKQQLLGLIQLNGELIRVLTGAVNSGLEVIPNFDEAALKKRSVGDPSLKRLDLLLNKNKKRLTKLTELSEKIGLGQLNHFYRGMRKVYKKYYMWPVIEHVIVYTTFVQWLILVSPKFAIVSLAKKEGWAGDAARRAYGIRKYLGDTAFPTEDERTQAGVLVKIEDGHLVAVTKPHVYLDKGNGRPAAAFDANSPDYTDEERAQYKEDLETLDYDAALKLEVAHNIKGTSSGGGKVNEYSDITGGFLDISWKDKLITLAPGLLFAEYIRCDLKKVQKHCDRYTNMFDDWLYGTTKKRAYDSVTTPDERFDQIVGREDIKAELMKVVEYICSPDKFDRAGIKVERGYLLAGEPQTGKTLTAKALSGEISAALEKSGKAQKMRLFEISTENLIKKGIQYYMDLARYQAPCILFLDELDLLRLQRDGDSKLLSEFLTSMSGSLSKDEKSHVIILAATNKPENLDFALRQHGRFGKMFWFDKPTFNNRIAFFKKECEKRCMDSSRFDFDELAQQTEGCSFGTLDIVMKKGLMLAKLDGTSVMQHHFEKSIDSEVKKLIPHGYDVPAEKEKVVAVHQTGKALMSILLEPRKQLSKVTVLPITQHLEEEHVTQQYNIAGLQSKDQRAIRYGGIFSYHWEDSLNLESQDELKKQCKILLAGNVAQTVYGLKSRTYDKNDKQEAFKLAKQIVFEGLEQKEVAKVIREEKLTEAYRLVEQYERDLAIELAQHSTWLESAVKALQERKTLSVGELKELQIKA